MSASFNKRLQLNGAAIEAFRAWLHQEKKTLGQKISALNLLIAAETWFDLLDAALDPAQDLPAMLATHSLLPAGLAHLFEITSAHLPASDSTLLRVLLTLQNRVMAAIDPLQYPPGPSDQTLTAATQLTQKLSGISQADQVMQKGLAVVAEVFGYPFINLFLVKNRGKTLRLQTSLWQNDAPSARKMAALTQAIIATSNVVTQAIKAKQAQMSSQPTYTPPPGLIETGAEMAAPLIMGQRVIGILHTFNHSPSQLNSTNLLTLQSVANQLAWIIENARLQRAVQRRVFEQKILWQSNATLGSSLDRKTVLTVMAQQMTEAACAGACVICRWNEKRRQITALAEYVDPHKDNQGRTWREISSPLPIEEDALGQQLLKTMLPVTIQEKDTPSFSAKSNRWAQPGWLSMLAIPLQSQGKPFGLVEIYDRDANRVFSQDDIQLSVTLARQTAIAIERTELFYETRNRLAEVSTFYTLSQQMVSTLNLDELLKHLVGTLRQIVDCRACVIFLLDETKQFLDIKAASGLKPQWEKKARLAVGQGAAGKSVAQKKTVYVPDTQEDPGFIFFDRAVRSLIVVPMINRDTAVGAINLDHSQPNAFGKAQERLLSVVAAQAAIAIENATLFSKVRSEEQRTRAIIQHMADGLLMVGPGGIIQSVNSTLTTILGMHYSEIVGQNAHADDLDPRLAAICAPTTVKERTGVLANEVTIPGPTPLVLRVFATIVTDKYGYPIGEVRVVHDVTKDRELEKMKDDLISTVSHELRTPLFSIRGFIHLLLDDDPPDPKTQREFLTIMEREANQLANMVTNLLDSDRISAGTIEVKKKPVQVIEIIQQTILRLQGFAQNKKVQLVDQGPNSLPLILGNAPQLEQILTNLVGNAIKFTPAEGTVTITTQLEPRHITIMVNDTGIGIPEADRAQIFTKFYQAETNINQTESGSGLGLHIAKQLIEQHNGQIWAESQLNQGSTFFVRLPILN